MNRIKFTLRRGILVALIVVLLAFLIPNVGTVRAAFAGARTLYALWRFEREVLRATPIGQYYEGLIFKHTFEAAELISKDPEAKEKLIALGEETIPLLEAYLNGNGDSTIITAESMNSLKALLDGLMAAGSPSLQADLQAEYERFPLENFIGMSMNDAYLHVLTHFDKELPEPALVLGADGKWAYYIYNGVYFEYPSNWYVQVMDFPQKEQSAIIVIPASENPSQWDAEWIMVSTDQNVSPESMKSRAHLIEQGNMLWEQPIQVNGMAGNASAVEPGIFIYVQAYLYNAEKKVYTAAGVPLWSSFIQFDSDPESIQERYEYLFHLIESVRILQ